MTAATTGGEILPGGEPAPPRPPTSEQPRPFDPGEPALLGEPARGEEALRVAEDDLAEVAARNAMTPDEIEAVLLGDDTAWLDADGLLFYIDPAPDPLLTAGEVALAASFPYEQTFTLNSKPGSARTIYLDFDGHLVTGTAWPSGTALPFDTDGNPSSFSTGEQDVIQSVWQRVAEDYAPFDVNVTTGDPGFDAIDRTDSGDTTYGTRLVVTDSPASTYCGGCGGVAYVGVFARTPGHSVYQPAWCFANSLADSSKYIAECASHEVGHNVGLSHDGVFGGAGYYSGHIPWAPIMGVGYNQPISQFSKGEYTNPSTTEDDFDVIGWNGVGPRGDDHSNTTGTATILTSFDDGVISSQDDFDTFRFTAPFSLTTRFDASPAQVSPNLDILLRLYSSTGGLIAESAPPPARVNNDVASGLAASITEDLVGGETYYLQVSGDSHLTGADGYTRYGSVGQYQVRVLGPGHVNDDLGDASAMTGPTGTVTGANFDATGEPGEVAGTCVLDPVIDSVWWAWTPPVSGPATIDTFGSDFDTTLAVYTGNTHVALTPVPNGCNDDASGSNDRSSVTVQVAAGQTYKIRVDGFGSESGVITLNHRLVNTPPVLNVTGPPNGSSFTAGSPVTFSATAGDQQSGNLTTSILWRSSRDGSLGSGGSVVKSNLSVGTHQVTARVSDGQVTVTSPVITVTINPSSTGGGEGDRFIDDNGHIFESAIEWLAGEGITQGCNPPVNDRFCPDTGVTRGQMAAFLTRAFDLSAYTGADRFRDDNGHVFEGSIERLAQAGITIGCNPPSNNRFCPDRDVTRGQMAAFLVRAFDLPAYTGPDRFVDDDGSVFEGAIERLAQAGITIGCNPPDNDRFCPNEVVTRGQMAVFLKRAFGA